MRTLIKKTYFLLSLSKICFFALPFSLKYGINFIQNPATIGFAPYCFVFYGIFSSLMTYFDGIKSRQVSHISLCAWKDISVKTYDHLLHLDASFHFASSQKSRLFSLYKAQQYIEKNVK